MKENHHKKRCTWAEKDPLMQAYHDNEWGVPTHDDRKLFEFLVLESAQAGLSWRTILSRRENYRRAFAGFNLEEVAKFEEKEIEQLMNDAGIIRNKAKIQAAINNAQRFLEVQKEFGSFATYSWQFVGNNQIRHTINEIKDYPVKIKEAEDFAKDLKKRGFKFLGPITIYAHMQAVGMVDDHMESCYRRTQLFT
ncbi:MAG: DNA-3-methyladenine glycosylase I [Bacteroidales bacterium]|nr:DNA-3-methyladenine glycosylase I [Bacteroidales bacterium]